MIHYLLHVGEALTDLIQIQDVQARWRDTTFPHVFRFNLLGIMIKKKARSVYVARRGLARKVMKESFYRFGIYLEDKNNDDKGWTSTSID